MAGRARRGDPAYWDTPEEAHLAGQEMGFDRGYEEGRGDAADAGEDDASPRAQDDGTDDRPARQRIGGPGSTRRTGNGRPSPKTFRQLLKGSPVETGASVVVGLVAYALVLSVVNYGAKGPLLWVKAKFLNETATSAKTTAATGTGTKVPPGTTGLA